MLIMSWSPCIYPIDSFVVLYIRTAGGTAIVHEATLPEDGGAAHPSLICFELNFCIVALRIFFLSSDDIKKVIS